MGLHQEENHPTKRFMVEVVLGQDGRMYANDTMLSLFGNHESKSLHTIMLEMYGIVLPSNVAPGRVYVYVVDAVLYAVNRGKNIVRYDPVSDWGRADNQPDDGFVIFFGPDPIPVTIAYETFPDVDMSAFNKTIGDFEIVSVNLTRNSGRWTSAVRVEDGGIGNGEGDNPGAALLGAIQEARDEGTKED